MVCLILLAGISPSKQTSDVLTTPEEDSAQIVKDVKDELANENGSGSIDVSIDPGWDQW